MKIYSVLLKPAKAVLKHTQSRRFATIMRLASYAKRLDCGGSPPLFHRTAMAAVIYLVAFGAMAQTTNDLSGMEIRGRQLAQQLSEQRPTETFTNTGVLQVRDGKNARFAVPVVCRVLVTTTNWTSIYEADWTNGVERLSVIHAANQPNRYFYLPFLGDLPLPASLFHSTNGIPGADANFPFAQSDFWWADLGLEFFHWPDQKILRGETMSGVFCKVLESTNPHPSTNGYSRVISWIDNESLGIVQAKAYDAKGKLLKEFYPKDIKKVDGQWQVGSMIIDNIETGSRSRLVFDLKSK